MYRDPKEYQQFIDEVRAGRSLFEKVLKVAAPDRDEHYVSVSTTVKSFLASLFFIPITSFQIISLFELSKG